MAQLSKRAIARVQAELSPQAVELAFIELHYGAELARRVMHAWRGNPMPPELFDAFLPVLDEAGPS